MAEQRNWNQEAYSDARDMLLEFIDQIAEQAAEGKVSDDLLNDYAGGDEYHHSTHHQEEYRLTEAALLLDALASDMEDDEGLWEGLPPREAIGAQASYTYGNAVMSRWKSYIGELNDALDGYPDEPSHWTARRARLWTLLVCNHGADRPESTTKSALAHGALIQLQEASVDGCRVYCDWLEEHGTPDATMRAAIATAEEATRADAEPADLE